MSLSRNQVAQLLLKKEDVNPNICENGERTPLIQAAICGHEETVRILLARKHANSNVAGNARHAAVAHSWQAGKAAVWRLQSKLQAANPNPPLYTQRAGGNASGVGGIVSGGDSWVGGVHCGDDGDSDEGGDDGGSDEGGNDGDGGVCEGDSLVNWG